MAENKDIWFDDPEWQELRSKINNRPSNKKQTRKQRAESASAKPNFNSAPSSFNDSIVRPPQPRREQQREVPIQAARPITPIKKPTLKKETTSISNPDAFDEPRDNRPVQISINLSLPSAGTFTPLLDKARSIKGGVRKLRPSAKQLKLGGGLAAFALVGFLSYTYILPLVTKKDTGSEVLSKKVEKPTFGVAVPTGAESQKSEVAYDADKKVANYKDVVTGVNVVVSQQQLPDAFKSDPFGELEKVAVNFNATESFAVKDFKVYIGTSVKGPQSLVMIKDKLLIFLRSDRKIPNSEWIKYIETLEVTN